MILFMWIIIFVAAFIPGGLVGWLVGQIPFPTGLCLVLLIGGSIAAGLVASRTIFHSADLTTNHHLENLIMFLPPILLSMMLGLRLSRAKAPQPW